MSRPSSPRPRAARARAAVLALVAVVALGSCSGQRDVPDSYGDTTERNFTEGCEEALTADGGSGEASSAEDAEAVCVCAYEAISDPEAGIDYADFKELNDALEDEPGPLSEEIRERIDTCRDEVAR